jgi:hypothetical protein
MWVQGGAARGQACHPVRHRTVRAVIGEILAGSLGLGGATARRVICSFVVTIGGPGVRTWSGAACPLAINRYRLASTDDDLRDPARLDRAQGAAGHNAQSGGCLHPGFLAGTRVPAIECPEPVTAGVKDALLAAAAARRTGSSEPADDCKPAVIVSQRVIVSPPQPITWALSLDSIVIGERMATTLRGVYMPFRRSPS